MARPPVGPGVDRLSESMSLFRRTSWHALMTRAARWLSGTSYLQRWLVLGVLIGATAGVGAIVFYEALMVCTHFFLGVLAGYQVPTPAGEGGHAASAFFARPWALPLVVGMGGLLGAVLVFRFAPEAEGHGTDAAISAVHHNPRGIRFRAVIVKIIASALPSDLAAPGVGRVRPARSVLVLPLLARQLDLSPGDARIAVVTGIGSGIGAIFGAPLGGAVLAAEILYRDDFDPKRCSPASSPPPSATSYSAQPSDTDHCLVSTRATNSPIRRSSSGTHSSGSWAA